MPPVFIHAGYPKVASTFMQHVVMPQLSGVRFYHFKHPLSRMLALQPRTRATEFSEDERQRALQDYRREIEEQTLPVVISHEAMCIGNWMIWYDYVDEPSSISNRIASLFPDATILLCLRPQTTWIISWWRQHIRGAGTMSLQEMLYTDFWFSKILPRLYYSQVVEEYRALFGADNVKVFFYGDLLNDHNQFVHQLCRQLGQTPIAVNNKMVNRGLSQPLTMAKMHANRWCERMNARLQNHERAQFLFNAGYHTLWNKYLRRTDRLVRPFAKCASLPEPLLAGVQELFREDNVKLAQLLGIDLRTKGFVLA